jgi:hypothetical protein
MNRDSECSTAASIFGLVLSCSNTPSTHKLKAGCRPMMKPWLSDRDKYKGEAAAELLAKADAAIASREAQLSGLKESTGITSLPFYHPALIMTRS